MATTPRIALVTGGMGGLGEAICVKLAALGYKVVTTHSPGNTKVADWLGAMTKQGYDFRAYPCDVADWDSAVACVQKVTADVGPIDVLVNNAGITRDAMFHRMTREQWQEVISTNLNGIFNMTHRVWPGMRDRKWGRIINISSVNGQKGQAGQVNYSAAKAGDIGFTKALAQEGARIGITVNAICPGYIGTEMVRAIDEKILAERILPQIPVGRLGEPAEIARCVVFLASEESGFITGATLSANGGQYLA
jgi:acetoacetyl-CoA reductase